MVEESIQYRFPASLTLLGPAVPDVARQAVMPMYLSVASCGFPSPADDYIDRKIDLQQLLVRHPASTFMLRASGNSMTGAGILDGDLLVVDRSANAAVGRIVIAAVDGELTVKRILRRKCRTLLMPENDAYEPIDITDREGVLVWGVVIYAIHKV